MRKNKIMVASIMAAAMAVALTGCGKTAEDVMSVSAQGKKEDKVESVTMDAVDIITGSMDEISKAAFNLGKDVTGEAVETESLADKTEEPVQNAPENPNPAAVETKTESPKAEKPETKNTGSGSSKQDNSSQSKAAQPENKSASSNSGSGNKVQNNPAPKSDSSGTGSGNSVTNTPKPHEHNWKEHTVTRRVWIPNIVTVDDYKDEIVEKGCLECDCGALFDWDEEGLNALNEHASTNLLKEAYEGIPCKCGGFVIHDQSEVQKVKVGSHEEDHGHYEEETYVDGYYCDCGAVK